MDKSSFLWGKSYPRAAAAVLARESRPMTTTEIAGVMEAEGWDFGGLSISPARRAYDACRYRERNEGDVQQLPDKRWQIKGR